MASGKEKIVLVGKKEVGLWLEYVWVLSRGRKFKMCIDFFLNNYFNIRKKNFYDFIKIKF